MKLNENQKNILENIKKSFNKPHEINGASGTGKSCVVPDKKEV